MRLPDDVTLAEGARSPLEAHPTWKHTTCPTCGGPATRETDTMDGFMESSWYELRYCSPHTADWLDQRELGYWMNVDQYIGGVEHATKHLIYARFFTKMLRDWGWIPKGIDEPFARLLNQGMVVKETYRCPDHGWLYTEEVKDGACVHCGKPVAVGRIEKMSKTLRNTVEPLELIEKYGADTVRIFSLFAAPPDSMLEWSDAGVEGAWRFLNRVYRMVEQVDRAAGFAGKPSAELQQKTHATIKRVSEDLQRVQVQHGDRRDHGAGQRHLLGGRRRARGGRVGGAPARADGAAPVRGAVAAARPRRAEMLVTHRVADVGRGHRGQEAASPTRAGQRQAARAARGRARGGARDGGVAGARARLGQAVDRRQGGGQGGVRPRPAHQLRRPCVAPRLRVQQRRPSTSSTGAPFPASSIRRAAATSCCRRRPDSC